MTKVERLYAVIFTQPSLRCNDAVQVERLDLKPLNVRATGFKRVEVNSLHLSVASFMQSKLGSTA